LRVALSFSVFCLLGLPGSPGRKGRGRILPPPFSSLRPVRSSSWARPRRGGRRGRNDAEVVNTSQPRVVPSLSCPSRDPPSRRATTPSPHSAGEGGGEREGVPVARRRSMGLSIFGSAREHRAQTSPLVGALPFVRRVGFAVEVWPSRELAPAEAGQVSGTGPFPKMVNRFLDPGAAVGPELGSLLRGRLLRPRRAGPFRRPRFPVSV
jgi:hypothetical protein